MPIRWGRGLAPAAARPGLDDIKAVLRSGLAHARSKGAEYADIRYVHQTSEELAVAGGKPADAIAGTGIGVGVRCLARGAWGFASANALALPAVKEAAALAAKVALASASANVKPASLSQTPGVVDAWTSPVAAPAEAAVSVPAPAPSSAPAPEHDPFAVKGEEKLTLLAGWEERMRTSDPRIRHSRAEAAFLKEYKVFASSAGSLIEQELYFTQAVLSATARGAGSGVPAGGDAAQARQAIRSSSGGWEALAGTGWKLRSPAAGDCGDGFQVAGRVAREAVTLLEAPAFSGGPVDLIIDPAQMASVLKETVATPPHWPGTHGGGVPSSAVSGVLSRFAVLAGAPGLSVSCDATIPGAPGSYGYDDEGVPGQAVPLLRNGAVVGELAALDAGEGRNSTGTMRAPSGHRPPALEISNLSLEPGDWRAAELVRDTPSGVYLDTGVAWEIKDGAFGRMLRYPASLEVAGGSLWPRLDAVADAEYWAVHAPPWDEDIGPLRGAREGFGSSPMRFRQVRLRSQERQGEGGPR